MDCAMQRAWAPEMRDDPQSGTSGGRGNSGDGVVKVHAPDAAETAVGQVGNLRRVLNPPVAPVANRRAGYHPARLGRVCRRQKAEAICALPGPGRADHRAATPPAGAARNRAAAREGWPNPPDIPPPAAPGRSRALASHRGFAAQRKVDDPPLPAVHGIETERLSGTLHLLRRRHGAQPQFLDAQQAVVVGVEGNPRMVLRTHPQRLHGDVSSASSSSPCCRAAGPRRDRRTHQDVGVSKSSGVCPVRIRSSGGSPPCNVLQKASIREPMKATEYFRYSQVISCRSFSGGLDRPRRFSAAQYG